MHKITLPPLDVALGRPVPAPLFMPATVRFHVTSSTTTADVQARRALARKPGAGATAYTLATGGALTLACCYPAVLSVASALVRLMGL